MTGRIYCISNTVNDKVYIGKTALTLEERFREHCRDSKKSRTEKRPLYSAMNKYGIKNFNISLIEEVETNKLDEREQYWIKHFDSYHNGYNATRGGDGKFLYNHDVFIEDYKNGMRVREIAKKYHCSTDVVRQAVRSADLDPHKNNIIAYSQRVKQFDRKNNLIQSFDSITAAARLLTSQGFSSSEHSAHINISRSASGRRKTAYGFIWKTVEIASM